MDLRVGRRLNMLHRATILNVTLHVGLSNRVAVISMTCYELIQGAASIARPLCKFKTASQLRIIVLARILGHSILATDEVT